jgi:cytoskeletal protein RodZ
MEKPGKFTDLKSKFESDGGSVRSKPLEGKSKKFKITKESLLIIIIILLLIALGGIGYLYMTEKKRAENPTQVATEEAQKVKDNVGKLIMLDESEEPTIATIIDIEALKTENPEFYKDASNGDKLLVYSQRAIIYNQEKNIIVNVAPVIRQPGEEEVQTDTEGESEVVDSTLSIELRNGSTTVGVTQAYEDQINAQFGDDYTVATKANAANSNYEGITVYDLSNGAKSELIKTLADEFSVTVETELPEGEATSDAEVVVIIGN